MEAVTKSPFDALRHVKNGVEYWDARELQEVLGWEWRKFDRAIKRAMIFCEAAGHDVSEHFISADKKVEGAKRTAKDWLLTRLGSYLTAMNGDPKKPEIAAAQRYFERQAIDQDIIPIVVNVDGNVVELQETVAKLMNMIMGQNKMLTDLVKLQLEQNRMIAKILDGTGKLGDGVNKLMSNRIVNVGEISHCVPVREAFQKFVNDFMAAYAEDPDATYYGVTKWLYEELEKDMGIRIGLRVENAKKRARTAGATVSQVNDINTIGLIEKDPVLTEGLFRTMDRLRKDYKV